MHRKKTATLENLQEVYLNSSKKITRTKIYEHPFIITLWENRELYRMALQEFENTKLKDL